MSSKKQPTDAKNSSKNSKASSKSASKIHMECTPGPSDLPRRCSRLSPVQRGTHTPFQSLSARLCRRNTQNKKQILPRRRRIARPWMRFNERLNIIEDMLARVAEALPPSGSQAFAENIGRTMAATSLPLPLGRSVNWKRLTGAPRGRSPGRWYATSTSDRRRLKIFFGDDGDPFIRGQIRSSNRSRQSSGQ